MLFLSLLLQGATGKAYGNVPENPDEDFVIASVMTASPGEELYSKLGHAFLRMQCPSHGMDFCFTYESEDAARKVMSFLSGNLKMGMQGIRTEEFLKHYKEEGRGVTQYDLRLPIAVKQNMWRILDNLVDEGMDLPYDYMERGCAYSVFSVINQALGEKSLQVDRWPSEFSMTRREIVCSRLEKDPWTKLFLNIITNGPIDEEVAYTEKTITPETLIMALENATVDHRPVLAEGKEVFAAAGNLSAEPWFTPMKAVVMLLALTIICFALRQSWMAYVMLGIQTVMGLFVCYLLFFSSLCATEWSWLVIPFNPVPAIFWKWRRLWEIPVAAILLIWCLAITFGGDYLMDPPLILLAFAIALAYAGDAAGRHEKVMRWKPLNYLRLTLNNQFTNLKPN